MENNRCNYYMKRTGTKYEKCKNKITKLDPEKKFCSLHKICEYVNSCTETKYVSDKQPIKYLDFITFSSAIIDK